MELNENVNLTLSEGTRQYLIATQKAEIEQIRTQITYLNNALESKLKAVSELETKMEGK